MQVTQAGVFLALLWDQALELWEGTLGNQELHNGGGSLWKVVATPDTTVSKKKVKKMQL